MAKKDGINIPVGVDTRPLQQGMEQAASIVQSGGEQMAAAVTSTSQKSSNGLKSLQQAYRATYKDAQLLAQQQGTNSQAFQEAALAAANYKDELEDVQDAIKAASPEQRWEVVGQAIQGAAQIAQGFVGTLTLIGIETKDAEKAIAQMMALQGISSAISGVFQLKDAFMALNVATQTSIIGIAAIAAAWLVYNATAEDTVEVNKRIAESTKAIQEAEDKALSIVYETNKLRIEAMQGGRDKDSALAMQSYKKSLADLNKAYDDQLISDMTYNSRKESLWQIYQNKLTDISKNAAKERAKFERQDAGSAIQLDTKTSSLGELATMASGAMQTRVDDTLNKFWTKVNGTNLRGMAEWKANWKGLKENTQESTNELVLNMESVAQGISGAINSMVGAAMRGEDVGKALTISLLGSMGAFMAEWGAQLILVGIGAESLKASLLTLNGVGAIAAGAALVAAGAIAIGTASSMANSQSSGSAGGYTPQGGSSFVQPSFSGTQYLMLDGKVRGQDLVIATSNTRRDNRR